MGKQQQRWTPANLKGDSHLYHATQIVGPEYNLRYILRELPAKGGLCFILKRLFEIYLKGRLSFQREGGMGLR